MFVTDAGVICKIIDIGKKENIDITENKNIKYVDTCD